MSDLVVKITGQPDGAIKAMADVSGAARDFSNEMVSKLAQVTAGVFGLEKAFEGVHAGILKADEIRDLTLSLGTLTGSFEKGAEAMRFFEEQAGRTRNTTDELARVLRDILPLAGARGFDLQATETITTLLSQFSTVMGTDLGTSESGFQMMLAGRVTPGRNPLLKMLGFTKENVDVTWDEFFSRLMEKTKDFDKFGQSFESASHKIKDAWAEAFGVGFNDALDNSRKSYNKLLDAFTNPALINAINNIGQAVGGLALRLANAASYWNHEGDKGLLNAPPTPEAISRGDWLVSASDQNLFGHGSSPSGYAQLGARSIDLIRQYGGVDNGMFPSLQSRGGASGEQFGPMLDAAQRSRIDFEAGMEALRKQAEHAGKVAIETRKAADAEKELADHTQDVIDKLYEGPQTVSIETGSPVWLMLHAASLSALAAMGTPPDIAAQIGPTNLGSWMTAANGGEFSPPNGLPFNMGGGWQTADQIAPAKSFAEQFLDAISEAFGKNKFKDSLSEGISLAFDDFLQSGGQNLGRALASGLERETETIFQNFLKSNFPQRSVDASGRVTYTSNGKKIDPTTGAIITDGSIALESGAAGFSAGQSGQSGSRTGADIEGAVAGFASGGWPGAIVGLVSAVVGGFIGAQQRQKDYQYGVPSIDESGIAHLGQTKNLTPGAILQITKQVQDEYDAIHSGLIDLILKFPDVAIPSFDEINGKFQDNPSAHWGEHLQQWITGTLPKELISALGDELATGFEQLGMSKEAFGKIFDFLKGIDPQKAIADMNALADALRTLFGVLPGNTMSVNEFFHGNYAPDIFTGGKAGSATFQRGMNDLALQGSWSPGQRIANQYDSQIFKDTAALNAGGMSPEEQIKLIGEIASLSKQRYDAEKQAIQEIYNAARSIKEMFGAAEANAAVEGMTNADGSPNYGARSAFYSSRANQDLSLISRATSAADVTKFSQQFITDLTTAEQLGIQGGGNLKEWNDWLQKNLPAGEAAATATLMRLGQSINTTNDIYNSKVDPALTQFATGVWATKPPLDDFRDGIIRTIDPINRLVDRANALSGAFDAMLASMAANGFAQRTAAQRANA